ncbi:uncharacterized protein LOC107270548 [Cephus cinctus]|uniref:Uncharacterized protein LOC107270548 n=1 Tax=Cephus cinctus TaxID=211228 RepID=A0AAJ7C3K1_CEPCN|nr:uncharacterized protein LOC107270548 [Cephus cinctus]XP_024943701.1 uncharacterized protein LOC107270548 [Cephus cinctus]
MGNFASKFFMHQGEHNSEIKAQPQIHNVILENNVMHTPPVTKRTLPVDPRSATVGISRTPIEVNCTPSATKHTISAIPKYLQVKPYLETDIDIVMPPWTPKKKEPILKPLPITLLTTPAETRPTHTPSINVNGSGTPIEELREKILGLDPRSPAVDFSRTPILQSKSLVRMRARSHENLTRRGSYTTDVSHNSRFSYCETTTADHILEIQALPDIIKNLENGVSREKLFAEPKEQDSFSSSSSASTETISYSEDDVTVIRNPNAKVPTDFNKSVFKSYPNITPESTINLENMVPVVISEKTVIKTAQDNINNVLAMAGKFGEQKQLLTENEDKIRIWRDSISPDIPENLNLENMESLKSIDESAGTSTGKEEVIIEFDDNVLIKNSKVSPIKKVEKKTESLTKKKKIVNSENIVTDDWKAFTPDGKSISLVSKNRTPLGNRSNNAQKQLMPTKSPQPILRNKTLIAKVQQENTPPNNKRYVTKSKQNGILWDPDSTVII